MTIIEAIDKINTLKPNSYTQVDKVKWLSALDGIIKTEIIDTHEGAETHEFDGYNEDTPVEKELLVPYPYDDVYVKWLEAQIDYANGDTAKYNNSMAMYNTAYSSFERYYNRTFMHKATNIKYF